MTPILPASRALSLLPGPRHAAHNAAPQKEASAQQSPRPAPVGAVMWSLSHETAMAACAVQMIARPRRGLKADAAERARFARAYGAAPINAASGTRLAESA